MLNFPIDRRGRIHENDERSALELAKAVKEAFAVNLAEGKKASASNSRGTSYGPDKALDADPDSYWATEDHISKADLTIDFGTAKQFNRFLVQE